MIPQARIDRKYSGRLIRIVPMFIGIASLGAGLWSSLMRLGWPVTGLSAIDHGPLMVGGFIGTVIALERAVALGRPWGYAAPWLAAISALLLLFPFPSRAAAALLLLSSLILLVIFGAFLKNQWTDFTLIMSVGALCWTVGNSLWLIERPIFQVVPWWAGFLILTIAGERVEMSRLRPRSPTAQCIISFLTILYLASLTLSAAAFDLGIRMSGVFLIGLSLWFIRYDIARSTIRATGLPRYAAFSVLSGYFWLIVSGLFAAFLGETTAGLHYDAWIHAQFLGFVLVMIMAHAPIILPAVAHISLGFTPMFYAPVILLHLSLAARISSDLMLSWTGRRWSGAVNIVAVLLFLAVVVRSVIRARVREVQPNAD